MTKNKKAKKKIEQKKKPTFSDNWLGLISVLVWLILLLLVFNPTPFTGGDNAHYRALAESISQGDYLRLYEPGTPAETASTPGYPILLAPFYALWPDNILPSKLFLSLPLFILALYFSFKLLRLYGVDRIIAIGIPTICVLNTRISEFSHWAITEAPSLFFMILAVYLLEIGLREDRKTHFIIACISAVAAVYIRLPSMPILAGFFLYLLYLKEWKKLITFVIITVLGLMPWGIWTIIIQGGEGNFYIRNLLSNQAEGAGQSMGLSELIFRLWGNFKAYNFAHLPGLLFSPLVGSYLQIPTGVLIASLALIPFWISGFIYRLKRKNSNIIPFLLIPNLLMLYLYGHPKWATIRYLVGAAPLFIFLFFDGLNILGKWLDRKKIKIAGVIILVIAILTALPSYFKNVNSNMKVVKSYLNGNEYAGYSPPMYTFVQACKWIQQNTPEDAILISRKPRLSYMWSKRPSRAYKFLSDPEVVIQDMDTSSADFIILDRFTQSTVAYLMPAIRSKPERFPAIYRTGPPETYVLQILSPQQAAQTINTENE